jgi:hypothetical protein
MYFMDSIKTMKPNPDHIFIISITALLIVLAISKEEVGCLHHSALHSYPNIQ